MKQHALSKCGAPLQGFAKLDLYMNSRSHFILQLSNQLAGRLKQNKIKVLAEVRLQANDPKRAIRTLKVVYFFATYISFQNSLTFS